MVALEFIFLSKHNLIFDHDIDSRWKNMDMAAQS
jgi:hypothetical protein